jgi:AcrR family transcriptional regulator
LFKLGVREVSATEERRQNQRHKLIDAAERIIAERGLSGLKARDLAREVGCAVGAIYNLVQDMDELVLRVGSRTLARLDRALSDPSRSRPAITKTDAAESLVAVALAYSAFARDNLQLWRTLFEYRMAEGAQVPDWSVAEQMTLFRHVILPLRVLAPQATTAEVTLLSRTLFSAVHGVVAIGLDDKLVAVPRQELDRQIETLVKLICTGLGALGQAAAR